MKIDDVLPNIGIAYIDMDGVIAWLDKGIGEYNNVSTQTVVDSGWDNEYWQNVLDTAPIKEFFSELDVEPHGRDLIDWFESRNLPISILSRPVRRPNDLVCIEGKKIWLQRQGFGHLPAIFERQKEKYAISNGKVNILIDDHSGNIDLWNKAGGIGIHYRDNWFPKVIKRLEELYGFDHEDQRGSN